MCGLGEQKEGASASLINCLQRLICSGSIEPEVKALLVYQSLPPYADPLDDHP